MFSKVLMFYVALNEDSCKDSEMLSRSFTMTRSSHHPSPDFKKPKMLPAGFGGNSNSMDKSVFCGFLLQKMSLTPFS